jgi:hypothetical protein
VNLRECAGRNQVIEHFFIVGAQRCGTTYLYRLLADHPEIEMAQPLRPEPKFFLFEDLFQLGLDYYEQTYFEGKKTAWLRGEKSTSYIESETVAQRLASRLPAARIIIALRDPVERAISNYRFTAQNGLEPLPMDQAFLQEEHRLRSSPTEPQISVSPYAYLARGRYLEYLRIYEQHFPREQIKLLLYEEFIGSLEAAHSLFEFLGVQSDYRPPSLGAITNPSRKEGQAVDPAVRRFLTDYFAEPNLKLARHTGLDLSAWQ